MPLFDVIEPKDIEAIYQRVLDLLASFEFSLEHSFEPGKLRTRLVTRPRSREERTEMLSRLMAAR